MASLQSMFQKCK